MFTSKKLNSKNAPFTASRKCALILSSALATVSLFALPKLSFSQDLKPNDTEIIVTSQRRSQKLQDVPISVTSLSAQNLQNMQAVTIGDLQSIVPNLSLHEGDAMNAVVYLRGVGQVDSLAFADPGVGVYVDDVYLGRAQGAFLDIYDIDRIEVLRGPQGTLYGRNTIGGAVKFVSKPFSSTGRTNFEGAIGDYGNLEFRADTSGSLDKDATLLGKLAIAYTKRDGFAHNTFDGGDDGDKNLLAGRLALQWKPNQDLTLSLSVDNSRDRPDTSRTPARATSIFGAVPASTDPFVADANFNDHNRLDTSGAVLVAKWRLSDKSEFKSISSYRRMRYGTKLDLDATRFDFFGVYVEEKQSQTSQEFQYSYNDERLNFIGGLYYFKENDFTYSGLFAPAITLVTGSQNDQSTISYALFGQATYKLDDKLSITAGLRYTYEHKDFARTQKFFADTTPYPVDYSLPGLLVTDITNDQAWNAVTPKLGLEYRLMKDHLLYASVSQGFKSGGFDGRSNASTTGAIPFKPELLTAYEIGSKLGWNNNQITLNSALFWNSYKDLQISSFSADGSGGFVALFTNAGAATMKGVEFELNARIDKAFTFNAVASYLDSRYDRYIGPAGADISDQHHLVNAPAWSLRSGATYRFDLGENGSLTLIGDLSYRSKTYVTVSTSEILSQKPYSLLNAALRWNAANGKYYAQLGVKNLGDVRYITHGFDLSDSLGYQLAYYGDPKTIRLSFGVKL